MVDICPATKDVWSSKYFDLNRLNNLSGSIEERGGESYILFNVYLHLC